MFANATTGSLWTETSTACQSRATTPARLVQAKTATSAPPANPTRSSTQEFVSAQTASTWTRIPETVSNAPTPVTLAREAQPSVLLAKSTLS